VRFAIEAGSEQEARAIADGVLDQMGGTAAIDDPRAGPVPGGLWTVTADVDLAGTDFEPDNAETRLCYLAGELGRMTWTSQISERRGHVRVAAQRLVAAARGG
jgi:hypothetical protein